MKLPPSDAPAMTIAASTRSSRLGEESMPMVVNPPAECPAAPTCAVSRCPASGSPDFVFRPRTLLMTAAASSGCWPTSVTSNGSAFAFVLGYAGAATTKPAAAHRVVTAA
ncbi:hypothetical protein ACFQX7_36635 [Luedemannella flava]